MTSAREAENLGDRNASSEDVPVQGNVHGMGGGQHRWDLRLTHQLTSDVGKLLESVEGLKSSVSKLETKVYRIELIVAAATGALMIIGYLIDKRFDQMLEAISKLAHP